MNPDAPEGYAFPTHEGVWSQQLHVTDELHQEVYQVPKIEQSRFLLEFLHVLEMPTLLEPRGSSRFLVEFMLLNPYFSLLLSVFSTIIPYFFAFTSTLFRICLKSNVPINRKVLFLVRLIKILQMGWGILVYKNNSEQQGAKYNLKHNLWIS
jgi:hypothetical protein